MPRQKTAVPDAATRLYGVTGFPLSHTRSPLIHNTLFRHYGLNALYLVFERDPARFDRDFIDGLKAMRVDGFNVTLPFKSRVMDFLDSVEPLAERIGAVNTVVNRDGKLRGFNTDDIGFYRAMISEFPGFRFRGSRALVLGAGGAAFGVCFTCLHRGCSRLTIANRTLSHAQALRRRLSANFPDADIRIEELRPDLLNRLDSPPDLIVNSTSYGLKGEKKSLISLAGCPGRTCVTDLIYNPVETAILREARRLCLRASNGLAMLLFQGFEAFRLWTGITPDPAKSRKLIFPGRIT